MLQARQIGLPCPHLDLGWDGDGYVVDPGGHFSTRLTGPCVLVFHPLGTFTTIHEPLEILEDGPNHLTLLVASELPDDQPYYYRFDLTMLGAVIIEEVDADALGAAELLDRLIADVRDATIIPMLDERLAAIRRKL